MLVSLVYAATNGFVKRGILIYVFLNATIYSLVILFGIIQPNKFLLSFEMLVIFTLPSIAIVIINSLVRYVKYQYLLDKFILKSMILFILVNTTYFIYQKAEICNSLYKNGEGFYFSENDVLHLGMIFWIIYFVKKVGKNLKDLKSIKH